MTADVRCLSLGAWPTCCVCLQVCNEAEITELVKDSEQAVQTEYLEMRTHNKGMH